MISSSTGSDFITGSSSLQAEVVWRVTLYEKLDEHNKIQFLVNFEFLDLLTKTLFLKVYKLLSISSLVPLIFGTEVAVITSSILLIN